ncbi:helix-turn-helix domain-containing protein [Rosenbergiella australiborealis]|uniref:helix-turn-helix domain-containing protein n=1 Tax=Rosenbergiella australiborealis TaxID=1544696 RepID=UPI0030B8A7A3
MVVFYCGRPKFLSKDKQTITVKLYDEGKYTVTQICELMAVSRPTLYKYIGASKNSTPFVIVG